MPNTAKTYIALVMLSGAAVLMVAAATMPPSGLQQFWIYLGLAALASTLKVRIPGMEGTMSPNFLFLLLAMAACSFSQVVVISLVAALVQSLWAARRPRLVQVAFSAATLMISSAVAYKLGHLSFSTNGAGSAVPLVLLAGSLYFPLNSAMVSIVVGLVERQALRQVMLTCYQWVFRHFMGGIIFAGLISGAYSASTAWHGAVVLLPAVVLAYLYYANRGARAGRMQAAQSPAAAD